MKGGETMNTIEQNESQIKFAIEMAKGRVVAPCVSIDRRAENPEVKVCPLLDLKEGCTVGFIKNPGSAVECPEGKGVIAISNELLSELGTIKEASINKQSEYGREIAGMELKLNYERNINIDGLLFV